MLNISSNSRQLQQVAFDLYSYKNLVYASNIMSNNIECLGSLLLVIFEKKLISSSHQKISTRVSILKMHNYAESIPHMPTNEHNAIIETIIFMWRIAMLNPFNNKVHKGDYAFALFCRTKPW